ncbi:MAG TPA: UDP-N-acetylmuramate dehydrogenase [Patescibacteria group bacterium]|nr:UDP-N-acetylmuramate dehydrogenase [Patescibacteria group bacterium]
MTIQKNIPLSQYTNWRIGGSADYFAVAETRDELISAVSYAQKNSLPVFVLGGGTNVLVSDSGFRGLVIKNKMNTITMTALKGSVAGLDEKPERQAFVRADAGVLTNRLVRYTCDQAMSGLENFLGQPGTVGGAMYINAHNMNQNDFFGDHVAEAELLTLEGELKTVPQSYFQFGYDESTIQHSKDVVVSVVVKLDQRADEKDAIWAKAEAAMKYRHETQPKGYPTAGCTFRNISPEDARRIETPNKTRSAGYLVDQCGLKGHQIGNAKFSDEHANFILNLGGATAADIKRLIDTAKEKVKEKFGVDLHEEVVLVGF